MSPLDASVLASLHHIDPQSPLATRLSPHMVKAFARTQEPQTKHRINVVDAWGLELDGQRVLEVGCGQGDASVVLSSAVGEGRVTAWDPASPDYGMLRPGHTDFRFTRDRW
jgi:precorrin-6B methylase 2